MKQNGAEVRDGASANEKQIYITSIYNFTFILSIKKKKKRRNQKTFQIKTIYVHRFLFKCVGG